ncbi:J domain-containing protein [Arthrobacter sp. UCD-GKA]|uniref:J domain-containing protein n=1 Tax=Arthrobacter sp. UCD-GKA TaxID=1913576 RepID=UPI001113FD38
MSDIPDLYSVLGLDPHATDSDIAHAYRVLLRRHHPDTRPSSASAEEMHHHEARLQQAMDAHAVLADPTRRAHYDRERHWHPAPPPIPEPFGATLLSASAPGPGPGSGYLLGVSPLRWDPSPRVGGASK